MAQASGKRGKKHVISTQFEHHAALRSLASIQAYGFEITLLKPNANGIIHPKQLIQSIRKDTGLVSVMYANNEIGTVQPIRELAEICRRKHIPFYTDAVQAVGQLPIDVRELSVDLLSFSGHKIHAPKGIGCLYVREGIAIEPLLDGGTQEQRRRAGTENVAGIAGLAVAVRDAVRGLKRRTAHLLRLKERFIEGLFRMDGCHLHGDRHRRLPGYVNVSFDGVEGGALVQMLDKKGICCSTGSACTSGVLEPSHVLLALGIPEEQTRGALRFTFSEENTETEIDVILKKLATSLKQLRGLPVSSECCCPGGCC
jgi:cysteine desulfurase